jgi:diguanylate cyclase (GGDEF)-like protein/PAS domain S-box-containing protein
MPDIFPAFFTPPPDSSLLYTGHHDPVLVLLSVAVAIFASYAALLVSQQVARAPAPGTRRMWLAAGGLCLGLGIWAMHFVGMLAFSLPCTTSYDSRLTLLSMAPGVLACTLALALISRPALAITQVLLGGVLLGLGIGTMHYVGMAALRLEGLVRYDLTLFLLSLALAVVLASLAIWVKFRLQALPPPWRRRAPLISATVMGLAVSGMHYTAMAAAYFLHEGDVGMPDSQLGSTFLATLVLAATGVIIFLTLVASYLTRSTLLSFTRSYKVTGLLIAAWCALAWFGVNRHHDQIAMELYRSEWKSSNQKLDSLVLNMDETLRGIRGIPQIFSGDETIHRALRQFNNSGDAPSPLPLAQRRQQWSEHPDLLGLNQELRTAATHLPIDVIWVMNRSGDTIAASNFDQIDSFVGGNFAVRQYFRQARAGQRGEQYGVGLLSKIPGIFYSYPVLEAGRFMGVITVKRNISNLANWVGQVDAFATDANGVVVLTPHKELEFRTLPQAYALDMSDEQLRAWYLDIRKLKPLSVEPWKDFPLPGAVRIDEAPVPSLFLSSPLPDGILSVHINRPLTELSRLQEQKNWLFALLAAVGSMLIIAASVIVLYLRESRQVEADLRIAAAAFESQEGMVITDARSVILRVNPAFTRMTGYAAQEAIGRTPSLLTAGRQGPDFYRAMWETLLRTGSWQGEIWNRNKSGEIYPCWLTITAVYDKEGQVTHYVGMHTDITQRKAAEEEIRHLAFYDPLTHLPNRRLLLDRLQQALIASARSARQGALLFIDLDHFKTLNDTRGHDVGDLLLQQVAQRLLACVREEDTVARLGGDEFVVMLENLSDTAQGAAAHAKVVGEKIINALNQPFRLARHEHHTTPSIGIALFAGDEDAVDDLLKRADLAMYQSKAAGRNTLRFFDPDMQTVVTARAALEADFRDGLRHEQLLLHYQGQVDHRGKLLGAEALVRWQHPRRGLVSPAEFIPMAEETGLILPLGQWVLDAACKQLVRWAQHAQTAHLTLAINVSARQFRHADFVAQILAVLDHTGADPKRLKLEITESLLLDDAQGTIVKMTELKNHGVGFALDDFGTGYSSLSYLKRLPLDQLKIDQSFVRDVFTDANDAAIVRTIVALAQSLGLNVIAEGVETLAQRDFLADQGCLAYQGYLFSRPGPVEDLFTRAMAPAASA